MSTPLASREQRDRIADEIAGFRFGPGFGRTLNRLLRHGVGVHHAGMLPKYRRVVERLTQRGLLPVVCGTDTLGVGINVPIRTVLLTSLVKYDGVRMRHLSAREFHQISGRAGRAGFDTVGEVIILAPEHVIENRKLLEKAGDDPRKLKKIIRKKAPEGQVNWTDKTFERLRDAPPEPLTSSFAVSHAMVLHVLARDGRPRRGDDEAAHRQPRARGRPGPARPARDRGLPVAARRRRDRAPVGRGPDRAARASTGRAAHRGAGRRTSRSTRRCPRSRTRRSTCSTATTRRTRTTSSRSSRPPSTTRARCCPRRRTRPAARPSPQMKSDGLEYDQRMALLEDVGYPKPLAELLEAMFVTYRQTNPWVADLALSPKSVVRDMHERAMSFAEYVAYYQLDRTEGVLLRYLADAYRALRQTVPEEARTEELWEIIEWLGDLVRRTDSSLLDEWERLSNPLDEHGADAPGGIDEDVPEPITANPRVFRALVRGALFRRVELAAREFYGGLAQLGDLDADGEPWDADRWRTALDPFYDDHDEILTGAPARGPALFQVTARPRDVAGPAAARRPRGRPRLAHRRGRRPGRLRRDRRGAAADRGRGPPGRPHVGWPSWPRGTTCGTPWRRCPRRSRSPGAAGGSGGSRSSGTGRCARSTTRRWARRPPTDRSSAPACPTSTPRRSCSRACRTSTS